LLLFQPPLDAADVAAALNWFQKSKLNHATARK
jgi:hypothetical protein